MSRGLGGLERFLSGAGFDRGPWLTVAFGAGIAAWFGLHGTAQWLALVTTCLGLSIAASAAWPEKWDFPYVRKSLLVLPLLVAAGCLIVWARSLIVGVPAIERPIAGTFTARILSVEDQPAMERDRLVVALREPGTGRAIQVRVNVPDGQGAEGLFEGDLIRFKARLMPPAPPMFPGGYDFSRSAWFSGLSASGSVVGTIAVVATGPRDAGRLSALRASLDRHVRAQMRAGEAGIAAAFITGDVGGISQSDSNAMRNSGLTHLLSISGLHVSALIGAFYVLAIRILALFPWLALRVRLPVIASAVGALAGIGYTILTGSQVPTIRSCVGSLLVLGALALGRSPLSLRMLAAGAFAVLMVWPESLTGPSFQMSFGAVLAIVALSGAEPIRRWFAPREESWAMHGVRHLGMILVTGVVIELSLMPIGLYHFHRAGAYGALANVIAIPLSTFVIMPLVGLALLFDVVGLGAPVWWLAQRSISLLLWEAHWFSDQPGSVTMLPAAGTAAFLIFVAGALWLGLWSGRGRLFGLIPAIGGALLLALAPGADVLVSGDGRHVGLVSDDSEKLFVLRDGGPGYSRDNLMEMAGMEGEPVLIADWPGARCNADFCALKVRRSARDWRLLISRGRDGVPERALAAACDRSDIVISDRWLPKSCQPTWFKADRAFLGQSGGLAVHLSSGTVETVAAGEGAHGWWHPAEDRRRRK